jgi:predicted Zn finger-like uncharacterized protein
MAQITHCPNCQRMLRVPDDLLGKTVKCPTCATMFVATEATSEPPMAPVVAEEASRPTQSWPGGAAPSQGDYEPRRMQSKEQVLAPLKAPAICLLIAGSLGLIANASSLVMKFVSKPGNVQDLPRASPQIQEFFRRLQEASNSPLAAVTDVIFGVICTVIILGAIAMLSGKMRWLAMTGSILAMINIGECCCVLGLPFGIWSLVALTKPGVAEAFQ